MNNNAVRNLMINEGFKEGAEWVLPFDGNCFLREEVYGIRQLYFSKHLKLISFDIYMHNKGLVRNVQ
jgi:hypothetical protein